mmetsp:Transcript_39082/g.112193  ORF Transcript_39082/g.112193 Transcript_39082/m.112193 type:complete len:323 (-) Transcript_39082:86-1054(-)|eukprot:CAMPEP_0177164520 /NCGR_PEP_ID=MMETSP0367-20130122/6992_1 /TAXON_ID=447022 ORGANISM="Scrippsiella hangoei-like, Strain SHHI-4" /NCGR_SAMPLE_ID=MMETSP0367 /ASSEMBLY_ACC=CAM_ASM_000362 /LENGTH=322 /DNA_ID=CAMNT_0018610423 /DNA_START=43 /DNA_END=1011 /DNA_ORIENTATION=+
MSTGPLQLALVGGLDVLLCLAYIALNAGLNFTNRWALGVHDFSFPMSLTSAHMLLNPVFLTPVMLLSKAYRNEHGSVLRSSWKALLVIAAFNGIQIALNNSSLVHIELSTNQVVRATMPVIVAIFEALRGSPPPASHLPVLLAIALGVILCVYQTSAKAHEWWGILLVVSSVSLQAAQMSFSGSLLSVKLDSFQMTFYTSPMAFLAIAGPTAMLEGEGFRAYLLTKPMVAVYVMVGTCLLAVVYNIVMFQTIRRLGPVGSAVLGNVKIVVLLVMSRLLMGEMRQWAGRHLIGCLLTFGGAAAYSRLKLLPKADGKTGKKKEK